MWSLFARGTAYHGTPPPAGELSAEEGRPRTRPTFCPEKRLSNSCSQKLPCNKQLLHSACARRQLVACPAAFSRMIRAAVVSFCTKRNRPGTRPIRRHVEMKNRRLGLAIAYVFPFLGLGLGCGSEA